MAFAASVVVSTVLLVRMLTLINRAAHGLADAAKRTDMAMETFVDLRSWGILRHGEIGCLTHVAAGRGMVRALDLLIQNGANPSSEDSTGKTPLEIAQDSGMTEACNYLEAAVNASHQSASIPVIASPLADKLRKKVNRRRSAQTLCETPGDDLAGEGGAKGSRRSSLTSGWKHIRKVAGSAVRWVSKSDKVSARRARGRVGVEPRDHGASPGVAARGHCPLQPAAEGGGALLFLPPALPISYHESVGGMLASGVPSAPSRRPISPEEREGNSKHDGHRTGAKDGSRPPFTTPLATACQGERGAVVAAARMAASNHDMLLTRTAGDSAARRDKGGGGAESMKGGERVGEGAGTTGGKSGIDAGTSARCDGNRRQARDDDTPLNDGGAGDANTIAERVPSPTRPQSSLSRPSSATFPGPIRQGFSEDDEAAGTSGGGGFSGKSSRSEVLLAAKVTEAFSMSSSPTSRLVSTSLRRHLSSVRATSTLSVAAGGASATYSPTQAVLNITWALRRLRPLGTPRERRMTFKGLRESSPVDIPQMFLLAFIDLAALGEIPRRTGDRFLGKADRRPVTVCELMARAGETGEDPIVVYVSHRWLEPDFKNPDDHSKARFYQARIGQWCGLLRRTVRTYVCQGWLCG